ncbi:MAG: MBOAT family O-acyltransferase [Leptospiraceae bacterium]|nr:MBOAT family O-acyltransferase [Leptospiraceae bacterium]
MEKNYFLKLAVSINLLNLFFFKYFYFFLSIISDLTGFGILAEKNSIDLFLGELIKVKDFEIALPLGISYYTFQFISIAVDKKQGKIEEEINLLDFSTYILFFPVIPSGPILRFNELKSQFEKTRITENDLVDGVWLILRGLFKKAVLSESVLSIVAPVFGEPEKFSGAAIILTTYFFGIYLFLEFSGFTDLARGFGRLLGYELPENFKSPLLMKGFGDFWRRWHLTFASWIRDYIYIPLGGSKVPEWRNYFNFILTFTLGGLWHGATLNYILWGFINGSYISIEKFLEIRKIRLIPNIPFRGLIHYLFVLNLFIITWILFFTKDIRTSVMMLGKIFTFSKGAELAYAETGVYATFFAALFHLQQEYPERFEFIQPYKKFIIPFFALLILLVLINNSGNMDAFYGRY